MTHPLEKILLYIDGSESSITASQFAIIMAKRYVSALSAIYVVNENLLSELLGAKVFVQMDYERSLEDDGKRYLNYVVKLGEKKGVKVETMLRKGIVHEEVIKEVTRGGYDLLVQGELGEVLSLRDSFYEEGERILRKVSCAVLVVRGRDRIERAFGEL